MISRKRITGIFVCALILCMAFVFTSCGDKKGVGETETNDSGYDIAYIPDDTVIEKGSVNEAIWEGIIDYGEEKGVAHRYFIPAECSTEGYLTCVDDAVQSGVRIVIMKDGDIKEAFLKARKKYPDIMFMYVAGDYTQAEAEPAENSVVINYHEEQAGFMAGYAAVSEKNDRLGVVAEDDSAASINYVYGFISGADEAARGEGFTEVTLTFSFIDEKVEDKDKEAEEITESMCKDGVKTVFAVGEKSFTSEVCRAADQHRGNVIGCNVDRSRISKKIFLSAVKDFSKTVKYGAELFYDGHFPGGKSVRLGTADEAVALDLSTANLKDFSKSDYSKLCDRLSDKVYKIRKADGKKSIENIRTEIVQVSKY